LSDRAGKRHIEGRTFKTGFNAMLTQWTESLKIDFFPGLAAFEDQHMLRVANHADRGLTLQGEKILIGS
jgi:pyruvate/2-oxoglutarate dehydrogenase complex dihydrolipoamide dehydrogenase (E3) component